MLTLKSLAPTSTTYNLAHDSLRGAGEPYGYKVHTAGRVDTNPQTGAKQPRAVRVPLPAALTFLAGEERKDLPNAVELCPEVRAALKPPAGKKPSLRVVSRTTDPPAEKGTLPVTSIAPDKSALTPATPDDV